jgi:phosphatidylglycerophosphatase C
MSGPLDERFIVRADANAVIERLERARVEGPSGLAFDADGTLWSGDVGEDVFLYACDNGLLRDDATEALRSVARAHGVGDEGSPSALARAVFEGYRRGVVSELIACETMSWCYAGHTPEELTEIARQAFGVRDLRTRVRRLLEPIFAFGRHEGLHRIVVSASPMIVVEEALRFSGIDIDEVAGAEPVLVDGRVGSSMRKPIPYGAQKPTAGRLLLGSRDWLGSFGDNGFDVEMLKAARIGVAVCPKPALITRLSELTNTVVLE